MGKSQRDRLQERRDRERRREIIQWTFGTVLVLGFILFLIFRPAPGQAPIVGDQNPGVGTYIPPESADHVADGEPVDTPTDPPTSGTHYASPMPAGVYTVDSPEYLNATHDGYLIHSLEHGYIIFWYNCDLISEENCSSLLAEVQDTMDKYNDVKLIAFPRPTIEVPLVLTSWGYMQEMETFDRGLAEDFIETNRRLAPEPQGS
ncbi:MAG: DUF3105 domain-containing protein [Anaerolineales bacterium]|jgi:hypothetical protein